MKQVRKIFFAAICSLLVMPATAGQSGVDGTGVKSSRNMFNHMDLGVTFSSTGLGAEISMPAGDFIRLRTGFTYMPYFQLVSNFGVDVNNDEINDDQKRRMKDLMENFTGERMHDDVDMEMTPSWGNFKFMVDVLPFHNKHWNFTVGFYAGPSRIGKAVNAATGTSTLVAVNTYNNLYLKACKGESMFVYEDGSGVIHTADLPGNFTDRLLGMGMMGMPLGYFANGDRAMMVPNRNHQAKAEMNVNKFRPYLGVGYKGSLSKDGKFKIAMDAGVMFWGGAPHVYVDNVYRLGPEDQEIGHADLGYFDIENGWEWVSKKPQRIDLCRDVTEIRGKVGDWVSTAKKITCFPVLNITFSHTLF